MSAPVVPVPQPDEALQQLVARREAYEAAQAAAAVEAQRELAEERRALWRSLRPALPTLFPLELLSFLPGFADGDGTPPDWIRGGEWLFGFECVELPFLVPAHTSLAALVGRPVAEGGGARASRAHWVQMEWRHPGLGLWLVDRYTMLPGGVARTHPQPVSVLEEALSLAARHERERQQLQASYEARDPVARDGALPLAERLAAVIRELVRETVADGEGA